MIMHCDNREIKEYANSDELGVYVRTGLHSSHTEQREHIQIILGSNDPSTWNEENQNSGKTAHIIDHDFSKNKQPFEAEVFRGQPHLGKRKRQ
jgi:hypothetical protein